MKIILFALCFFVVGSILAQDHNNGDKVFFKENGKITRKERKADYYRVFLGNDGKGYYYVKDYFITGEAQFSGKVNANNSECWSDCNYDGLVVFYNKNGTVDDYKFYENGVRWQGCHSYNMGDKHYEATFTDGKITTLHKQEKLRSSSGTSDLVKIGVGAAVVYGLYKLFTGSNSGSSSPSSDRNSYSEKNHNWTCQTNGTMIIIRQSGSAYHIGDETFSSWAEATKRACIKTNCRNCN